VAIAYTSCYHFGFLTLNKMNKIERLNYDLKKSRLENQILKTENAILTKLNKNSSLPLCLNELIGNLKKQNRILDEENKRLINQLRRKEMDAINRSYQAE
jgi:t-SNARE complex subunit (syntaxin)